MFLGRCSRKSTDAGSQWALYTLLFWPGMHEPPLSSLGLFWLSLQRSAQSSPLGILLHLSLLASFWRFLSCLDQRTCHMGLGLLTCLPDRPSAARAEKRDYIFSFQTLRACQHKIYVECMNEPNGKMKLERW